MRILVRKQWLSFTFFNGWYGSKIIERVSILDGIYWSRGYIGPLPEKWEFNKPYILAKDDYEYDTLSIEATSYALMTYMLREGITVEQEQIVEWLNEMRQNVAGFIGTVVS